MPIAFLLTLLFFPAALLPAQTSAAESTPVGVAAKVSVTVGEGYVTDVESFEAAVTVLEIARGEKAWELVKLASTSNRPPDPGMEYICARIRFEFGTKGSTGERAYAIRDEQFASVAGGGRQYERTNIVLPKPQLNGRLYPGETLEGWIALFVSREDKKPLMTFGNNYSRVWFKLY
jgi:hypothetical protein